MRLALGAIFWYGTPPMSVTPVSMKAGAAGGVELPGAKTFGGIGGTPVGSLDGEVEQARYGLGLGRERMGHPVVFFIIIFLSCGRDCQICVDLLFIG